MGVNLESRPEPVNAGRNHMWFKASLTPTKPAEYGNSGAGR